MKALTKSRFKLGLECPNKLFYTGKEEYVNRKVEDPFLEALAQGGFQVEEFARMHFPGGILIEGDDGEYEKLWLQTKELLQQENAIIYEAAFLVEGLFIRTDIITKSGNNVALVEVKSKSFDPTDSYTFIGKKGGLLSSWKPYLFDIAFQKYVMQLCYPYWNINSFLMMADKTKSASIDGLNQLFRIRKKAENRTGIIRMIDSLDEAGNSVLGKINVDDIVAGIESNEHLYHPTMTFQDSIQKFKECYKNNTYIGWPTSFTTCKTCEFKASEFEEEQGLKSGFKECFTKQHNWGNTEFKRPNTFDIWNFRKGAKLFDEGIIFKDELTEENIGFKEEIGKLSTSHRQWLQIQKDVSSDDSIFILEEGLIKHVNNLKYPLNFIDFETSTSALPFSKGRRPYEQIAFQFSHHIYHKDGRIEHASEFINTRAGFFPNFEFIRNLKNVLSDNPGTIFRYSHHENTILNAIYEQLVNSAEADKTELIDFIEEISHSKRNSEIKWEGSRDMIDLCELIKIYYYNPLTGGSNSIKDVLPAVLNKSKFLQNKYSQPISASNISSKNFPEDHIWLINNGKVGNPYDILPPVFENWTEEKIQNALSEIDEIADGGAALTAYAKLQYTDMKEEEVEELTRALLKYCELDTLAMVMIFEHLNENILR